MPCHITIYDTEASQRSQRICDEDNTARIVEDDYAAEVAGEYTDVNNETFSVDWTRHRLIGFLRKRDDGAVIASGGADGSQTEVT